MPTGDQADGGRLPTFLVVGAQKSGTTSLIHYLGAHPEVFAVPDEIHFFDRNWDRGVEWYRERFAGAGGAAAVGESTPEYMYASSAPGRIARTLSAPTFLAILRDPVDRAYSHYWHNRTRGHEPRPFDEAVAAEEGRLARGGEGAGARYGYVDRGRYHRQLRRLCEGLPGARLHVVILEELRDRRVEVIQDLYRHLGVADDVAPPALEAMKNRFMTFRSQRLRAPIRRLPGPLRRVAARLNMRYTEYPPLADADRARLRDRFREENDALASWQDLDLSRWDR